MKDVLDYFNDLPNYPGKRKPKNRPVEKNSPAPANSSDPFAGVSSRKISVKGTIQEFYTIGALAKIVGRSAKTVRKWEDKGWIPTPSFRTGRASGNSLVNKTKKGYRLYSKEQVELIYRSLENNGLLGTRDASWQDPKRWLSFIEAVRANWPK